MQHLCWIAYAHGAGSGISSAFANLVSNLVVSRSSTTGTSLEPPQCKLCVMLKWSPWYHEVLQWMSSDTTRLRLIFSRVSAWLSVLVAPAILFHVST
jgi:hypothetical protein